MALSPFRSPGTQPASVYHLEANPRVASPLYDGLSLSFLWPLLSLPVALGFVFLGAFLSLAPAIVFPLAFLLALAVAAFIYRWHVKRHGGVLMESYPNEIVLRTSRKTVSFPRDGLEVGVESREWVSPRTSGHNTWTILTLRSESSALTVGTSCLFQKPSGRTGQPQLIAPPEALRDLAEQLSVDVAKETVLPPRVVAR